MIGRIGRIIASLVRVVAGSAVTTVRRHRTRTEAEPTPQPQPAQAASSRQERVMVQTAHGIEEVALPSPSVWPFVVGLGTMLSFFGVVTSPIFIAAGLLTFLWGLGGWIAEIRHG